MVHKVDRKDKLQKQIMDLQKKVDHQKGIIDKLKTKEKELNEIEQKYGNLYYNSIVCMMRLSIKDHRVFSVNPNGAKMFEYSSEEEFAKNFKIKNHCLGSTSYDQILYMLNKTGFISGFTLRMSRKDKTVFWAEFNATTFPSKKYIECSIVDITEQKHIEEFRKYSEKTLTTSKRNIPDIIYRLDTNGKIIYISDPIKGYGYSPDELIGKKILDLVHPVDREKAANRINERRTGIRSTKALEVRLLRKKDFYLSTQTIRRKKNDPISLVTAEGLYESEKPEERHFIGTQGIFIDVTERKKAEEALRRAKETAESANRLKTEFLANMSHNIRTPLNGILGFANLLMESNIMGESRDYVTKIINSGDDLLHLLSDILDFSKMETGQLDIYKQTFLLKDLMDNIESTTKLQYKHSDVIFKIEVHRNVPEMIHNDKWRIHQVVTNLLSNAFKYTEKGSVSLIISYKKTNDFLEFRIQDTGIGISKKDLDQIFLPFFHKQPIKGLVQKGPGLGLAICKNLVELMGGSIKLKSRLKSGTEFVFAIPANLHKIKEKKTIEKIDKVFVSDIEQKYRNKILIVEDNPVNRVLIKEQFRKKGFKSLILAKNGREAVDLAIEHNPDIILMDIQMPEMDGNEAIKRLRHKKKFMGPILAVSAYAIKEEIDKSIQAGANDYIPKPINFDTFFQKINQFLKVKGDEETAEQEEKVEIPVESALMFKIDDSISEKVLEIFITDSKEKINIMEDVLLNKKFGQDKEKIKGIAHELKGNAGYFGLDNLGDIARDVDMAFKNNLPEQELEKKSKDFLNVLKKVIDVNT
jgi:PAS domain S-box-containing protein